MLKYLRFYEERGIRIEKALNQYVWDSEGRKYLDLHTGHGVAFLGHNNPHVINALTAQLGKLMTLSTSFSTSVMDEMLDTLSKVVPSKFEYVVLLNSGSEAVELALKIARRVTRRKSFVAFTGSFHGRTLGALSVTHNPRYRKAFEPLVPGVRFGRFNDASCLDKLIGEDTAGVIIEVIQGEGGVNIASEEFIRELRRRTYEVGALLIIDEVQTGFGRTGRVWAHRHYGIEADILLAGKALGGGFPVSAVFIPEYVASKLVKGDHGSTYGGNPLACAAVKAATEVLIKDSVPTKAMLRGAELLKVLKDELEDFEVVREVRGVGLMIGIDLRFLPGPVLKCAQKKGVLLLKAGTTVVRLLPPYMIEREDIGWCVSVIKECIQELSSRVTRRAA